MLALSLSLLVASFFSGVAVRAFIEYVGVFNTPWRWSLAEFYRMGGFGLLPGLAWVAAYLALRSRVGRTSQWVLPSAFAVLSLMNGAYGYHILTRG